MRTLQLSKGLAARLDGRPLAFGRRGADRLLAYLALKGPSARARVAEALWPAVDRERGLASLRQAVRAVHVAGGEGWVESEGTELRLGPGVEVEILERKSLFPAWGDAWLDGCREGEGSGPADAPPLDELYGLIGWYRDRAPGTAVQLAVEALSVLRASPPARLAHELAPALARLERLPANAQDLCDGVARAHYLLGDMERAYALYGRIAREIGASDPRGLAGRLSQVVILRETGRVRAAARLAEATMSEWSRTPHPGWHARYHLGFSRHLAGLDDGLSVARAAVESSAAEAPSLPAVFGLLNVTEGLLDAGDPAAREFLRRGTALVPATGDRLAALTFEMLEGLWTSREAPDAAFERLRELERLAWEARLVPFAATLLDRAATLAHRIGRQDAARRLLARGERVRKRFRLPRVPIERARLASLR